MRLHLGLPLPSSFSAECFEGWEFNVASLCHCQDHHTHGLLPGAGLSCCMGQSPQGKVMYS